MTTLTTVHEWPTKTDHGGTGGRGTGVVYYRSMTLTVYSQPAQRQGNFTRKTVTASTRQRCSFVCCCLGPAGLVVASHCVRAFRRSQKFGGRTLGPCPLGTGGVAGPYRNTLLPACYHTKFRSFIMPPPLIGGGIKRCFCLASVCLSDCHVNRA